MSDIFVCLDQIRLRPEMFLPQVSLSYLETLIWGYGAALRMNGIVEDVPQMSWHFLSWLVHRFPQADWSRGWPVGIPELFQSADPVTTFFELVDEYRCLRPTVVAHVMLKQRHQPTGARVRMGFDQRMEKPDSVAIVQYAPEPLHFLRFQTGVRRCNDRLLMNGDFGFATTIEAAKAWVRDELQVDFNEWTMSS